MSLLKLVLICSMILGTAAGCSHFRAPDPINVRCPRWTQGAYNEFSLLLEKQQSGEIDIHNFEMHISQVERVCKALDEIVCGSDCNSE